MKWNLNQKYRILEQTLMEHTDSIWKTKANYVCKGSTRTHCWKKLEHLNSRWNYAAVFDKNWKLAKMWKTNLQHGADILRVGEIKCSINLIQNINRRRFE